MGYDTEGAWSEVRDPRGTQSLVVPPTRSSAQYVRAKIDWRCSLPSSRVTSFPARYNEVGSFTSFSRLFALLAGRGPARFFTKRTHPLRSIVRFALFGGSLYSPPHYEADSR